MKNLSHKQKSKLQNTRYQLKNLWLLLLIGTIGLAFSSCSSLEMQRKQNCKTMDSYKKGLKEAKLGKKNLFRGYQEQCQKYGISLNKKQFEKGRTEGLKVFCVKKKGYHHGLSGRTYNNICPKDLENLFLTGYKEGARKCLFDKAKSDALYGQEKSFEKNSCLKLEGNSNEKEYNKGYKAGLKEFCVQKKGYERGKSGKSYKGICSGKAEANFLVGYRKGIKECLYNIGYNHAVDYDQKSSFKEYYCSKTKGVSNLVEYNKGYSAGLVAFCTQASGYSFGLKGGTYKSICPKKSEAEFFKGYTKGMQEYNEKKEKEAALMLEKQRIRNERQAREEALDLERQRIRNEQQAREEALNLQRESIENQEEILRLQKLRSFGYQACRYSTDCKLGQYCRYDYSVKEKVCKKF